MVEHESMVVTFQELLALNFSEKIEVKKSSFFEISRIFLLTVSFS